MWGAIDALPPIPGQDGPAKFLSSIVYNIDRLANPEVQCKHVTLDGIKSNEDISVRMARFFFIIIWLLCVRASPVSNLQRG